MPACADPVPRLSAEGSPRQTGGRARILIGVDNPTDAEPTSGDLVAWVELVRSDIKTEKALIVAKNIQFTEDEAIEFWPLHREYNLELNKLLDQRLYLLNHYMGIYESMTDKQASDLAKRSFDLEEKRTKLKRRYSPDQP